MALAASEALQCSICLRIFKRNSHLRRHERIHLAARPFPCSECSRSFMRRDALQRHKQSHIDTPSLLQLGTRACTRCATAKTRCTGETPCKRCADRDQACTYPTTSDPSPPSADASGNPSTFATETLMPSNLGLLPEPPVPAADFPAPGVGQYDFQQWDDGLLFGSNWLEASIGTGLDLSPLSWNFPVAPSYDSSPVQSANGQVLSAVSGETPDDAEASHVNASQNADLGDYYIDGEPSRRSRTNRKTRTSIGRHRSLSWSQTYSLQLPDNFPNDSSNDFTITNSSYSALSELYTRLCGSASLFGTAFNDHVFPSKHALELLIGLYWDNFKNVLPFLHWTITTDSDRHCLLDLGMAAIGSQFIGNARFSASLHEACRRALLYTTEVERITISASLATCAAMLLNVIGMAYSGDSRLKQHALQARPSLKLCFEESGLRLKRYSSIPIDTDIQRRWHDWVLKESERRLAASTWLVDTMLAIHQSLQPSFRTGSITFDLPSSESLWQSQTPEAWNTLFEAQIPQPNMLETLQTLYYSKSFSNKQCEFSRILVIHALFHRLWEVERYYSDPLSHMEPSSSRQAIDSAVPNTTPWLPAQPTFRNWQNASCDALDVLHWQANSTIGQMRGLEHPTVLHLHFARIVLLCPCSDIMDLVHSLTSSRSEAGSLQANDRLMNTVRRWAVHHQYKARLAAIHAGATFWHVRRHGIDAFYEAPSLGLAALVLWAFSCFAERRAFRATASSGLQRAAEQTVPSTGGMVEAMSGVVEETDDDNFEQGTIILLDRPTDDELVQLFIRDGASMRPHIGGVGEVFSPRAPPCILDLGIELLNRQGCWGGSTDWIKLLTSLRKTARVDSRSK